MPPSRGRRGPVKLRPDIVEFIRSASAASGQVLAEQVADRSDPREQALAACYQFLLGAAGALTPLGSQVREGWS